MQILCVAGQRAWTVRWMVTAAAIFSGLYCSMQTACRMHSCTGCAADLFLTGCNNWVIACLADWHTYTNSAPASCERQVSDPSCASVICGDRVDEPSPPRESSGKVELSMGVETLPQGVQTLNCRWAEVCLRQAAAAVCSTQARAGQSTDRREKARRSSDSPQLISQPPDHIAAQDTSALPLISLLTLTGGRALAVLVDGSSSRHFPDWPV